MFEALESIPGYSAELATHITRDTYNSAVIEFKKHLDKAFKLYSAWWKGGDDLLFDMSLEELLKAAEFMDTIIYAVGDEKTIDKLSKRSTFMYDLAGCMLGATDGER